MLRLKNDEYLVAVYGTLKRGYWNHSVMKEAGGEYVGDGITLDTGYLFNVGFPYWLPKKLADSLHLDIATEPKHLIVEVYKVKDLEPLDILEGYPTHYTRENTPVFLLEGDANVDSELKIKQVVMPLIYIPANFYPGCAELISDKLYKELTLVNPFANNKRYKIAATYWTEGIEPDLF